MENITREGLSKIFIIGWLVLFCGSATFAQQTRGLKITNDLRSSSTADFYDNSYAVIVGINDYQDPNVTNLDYAVADAESIKELLIRKFNYKKDNIKLFLNGEATRSNIISALSAMNSTEHNSQVLFYFAGHGETIELPSGGDMGVLLTHDTYADNLFATGLRMNEINEVSSLITAKHQLFLVDACYGGLAAVTTRALSAQSQRYLSNLLSANARQIITAGGKEEKVIEKAEWGHSAFAKVMLDALDKELGDLDKNGIITAEELAAYLKPTVYKYADGYQRPVYQRFTHDEGDFVFVLDDVVSKSSGTVSNSVKEPSKTPAVREETEVSTNNKVANRSAQEDLQQARALYGAGKYDQAIDLLKRTVVQYPQNGDVYLILAVSYQEKYKELLRERDQTRSDSKAMELHNKALRQLSQAMKYYEKITEMYPDNKEIWETLYNIYIILGMDDKADEAMQKMN